MDFVEICNVYIGKMIIKAAKRIFNSDKICRSYSDLNFGVTFLEHSVVDVLYVRLTELHAAHQNLPPAIRALRLKETIQNIHQKRTKSDNMIRMWHEFSNRSNLFITYFQCLMGFSCVTVQLRRSSHYTNLSSKKVTKWHLLWMQYTKTCLSRLIKLSRLTQML